MFAASALSVSYSTLWPKSWLSFSFSWLISKTHTYFIISSKSWRPTCLILKKWLLEAKTPSGGIKVFNIIVLFCFVFSSLQFYLLSILWFFWGSFWPLPMTQTLMTIPLKSWHCPCWLQSYERGGCGHCVCSGSEDCWGANVHTRSHRHADHHTARVCHRDHPAHGQLPLQLPHQWVQLSSGESLIRG